MIEVKVLCPCGTKFKFDVEPVNHLIPASVACPSCGQDATDLANADLHQKLPVSAASAPLETDKPRVRLAAHTVRTPAPAPAPELGVTAPSPPPVVAGPTRTISPAVAEHFKPVGDRSVWIGVAGALVGGFAGMMIWFLLIKLTHYEIGWIAWGVGALTGIGARVAGSRPTAALGVFTAICACVAIIGGQFLATRSILRSFLDEAIEKAYSERLAFAKDGVNAKTDEEIRTFLTLHPDDVEEGPSTNGGISAARVQEFRERQQGVLREFVDGKPSKEEFGRTMRRIQNTMGLQFLMFKESFSFFTLLWLFLGMGSAFKLASGASD